MIPIHYKLLIDTYRKILYYFGSMMLVLSGLLLTPLIYLIFDRSESSDLSAFLFPAIISLALYFIFGRWLGKRGGNAMSYEEAGVSITLTWIVMCAISALPVMTLNRMSFPHAYFEAMSGYTTTGLSLVDYGLATNMLHLWRAIMQYAGGAGIAIFLISLASGPYGSGLTTAEGKSDLLVPQIRRSARLVLLIYISYAVVGVAAYKFNGMSWVDCFVHTFGALSTGGFSTHVESIAWFNSIPIEVITIVLMIFGNFNFLAAYILLTGKFRSFFRNGEIKVQLIIIPLSVLLLMLVLTDRLYGSASEGFRKAIFETVSALTTTGFTSTVYTHWSSFGLLLLALLMLIGGGSNSTAGGLKQYRVYFLWKSFIQSLKELTSPQGRVVRLSYWWGDKQHFINQGIIQSLLLFCLLYFGTYIFGVITLTAYGFGLQDSIFDFASALSNSGLSVGLTSRTLPLPLIWMFSFGMLVGRLEILIVIIALGKLFRDAKRIFV